MSYTDQDQGNLTNSSQNQGTGSSQDDEDDQTTEPPTGEKGESEKEESFDETLLEIEGTEPEKVPKVVIKEDEGQKQVSTWYNRIVNQETDDDGEVFTVNHPKIPKWVQESIEKKLGLSNTDQKSQFSRDDIKEEVMRDIRFETLLGKIPKLPKSHQLQIQKLYKRYTDRGMNKVHALEEALDILEVEVATENRVLNRALRSAAPDGDPTMKRKKKEIEEEITDSAKQLGKSLKVTDEDRKKYAKKLKEMKNT